MKIDGDRIILETTQDGFIAAEAARLVGDDGLASGYFDIAEHRLPLRMGKWASSDVIKGLQAIRSANAPLSDEIDASTANDYLGRLGLLDTLE